MGFRADLTKWLRLRCFSAGAPSQERVEQRDGLSRAVLAVVDRLLVVVLRLDALVEPGRRRGGGVLPVVLSAEPGAAAAPGPELRQTEVHVSTSVKVEGVFRPRESELLDRPFVNTIHEGEARLQRT